MRRDAGGIRRVEQFAQDLRFGIRALRGSPGFTAIAVLTLALASGATTAIFGIVDSVLLRPLPFADPDRLVHVYGRTWRADSGGEPDPLDGPLASIELEEFALRNRTFDGVAGYALGTRHLQSGAGVERLTVVRADPGFFTLMGVRPIAGRTFRPGDPPAVAVISAALWRRLFGGDPSVTGRTITLDGHDVTLLGVMPDAFQFPYSAASMMPGALPESRTDMWLPLEPVRTVAGGALRQGRVHVIGRLKPGVTVEAATSDLRGIAARIQEQHYAGTASRAGVRVVPLAEDVKGTAGRSLWLLFAAASLVLVAACVNIAHLLLARMTVRSREVSTRAALGATRSRLIRQFLAESLLLSLAGCVIGAAIARWTVTLLVRLGAPILPRAHEVTLDWRTFGFLLLACVAAAVLFGLAPALTAARTSLHAGMRAAGGHATMGRSYSRARDVLVVAQVALAFVLGLCATLLVREVIRLRSIDPGMAARNVLTLHLTPPAAAEHYHAIEERVRQLRGMEAAGFIQLLPLQNWGWEASFTVRGRADTGRRSAGLRYVTPGYFGAMGIPLRSGRLFASNDRAGAPAVVLVNETLARTYFPGEDAVGLELDRGTIVGIVGDVRQAGLDRPAIAELYYPAAQNLTMAPDLGMTLVGRVAAGTTPPIDAIRAAIRDVRPDLAIFNVRMMEQVVADSLWQLDLYRWLIGLFAALVLGLAAIGLYGVLSYTVTSRAREFAVRLAVGSDTGRLMRLVLRHGLQLTAAGITAGVLITIGAAPALRRLSEAVRPDVVACTGVATLLLGLATLACVIPARRVTAVNPAVTLRHD